MPDRLLDTNAISAAMVVDAGMVRYLSRMNDDVRLFTSVVVEGELHFGIARMPRGRKRERLESALAVVMERMADVLPVTRPTARRYAAIKAKAWAAGRPVSENDLWIAATALEADLVLVTRDGAFDSIHGLTVEDWSEV